MSGKFIARASALSLAVFLVACGGDDNSTPIVNVNTTPGDSTTGGGATNTGDSTTTIVDLGTGSGSNFIAGQLQTSATNLAAGSSAVIEVNVVDASAGNRLLTGEEVEVTFTSSCIDTGKARLSANPVTITSGVARTTYTAAGCSGQDLITAKASNSEASISLNVEAAVPVTFIAQSPSHSSIAPKGSSGNSQEGRPASSSVPFQLIDRDENGIEGVSVSFEIYPADSETTLSTQSDTTGEGGIVTAVIEAGTRHEVVRVVATATSNDGTTISTTSPPIAVNSYIPEDSNFSISLDNYTPDAMGIDGVPVNVTITAADRYGNAILGNTIVGFTTSNGSITANCELGEDGRCTVTWLSLNTRQARPRITAYTQGEKYVSGDDCDLPGSSCEYEFSPLIKSATLAQSSSDGVEVTLTAAGGTTYCATTFVQVYDENTGSQSVIPPAGTTINFETINATILNESQASKTIDQGSKYVFESEYVTCIDATPGPGLDETPALRVVVTPPGGSPAEAYLPL